MRSDMAQHGEATAGDCLCHHAPRVVRDGFRHGAANVETKLLRRRRIRVVVNNSIGLAAGDRRQARGLAPFDETPRRIVHERQRAKMFKRGDQRRFDLGDRYIHFAGPFSQRNGELVAKAPVCPGGTLPEPAGRLAECVLERAREGLGGFKSRVQRDVDDPVFRIEGQSVGSSLELHQLDISSYIDAAIFVELPMKVKFGKIRDTGETLHGERIVEMLVSNTRLKRRA